MLETREGRPADGPQTHNNPTRTISALPLLDGLLRAEARS